MVHSEEQVTERRWVDAWDAMFRENQQEHRRPPWQFKLRTLLIVMLSVACFLGGWMANEVRHRQAYIPPTATLQPPEPVCILPVIRLHKPMD